MSSSAPDLDFTLSPGTEKADSSTKILHLEEWPSLPASSIKDALQTK
jgi:hypothetical protein